MLMPSIYHLIKLNKLLGSHRLKFAAAFLAHTIGVRHLSVRIDPLMACNLRCMMCYFSNPEYVRGAKGIFSMEDLNRLAAMFFPKALMVVYGCGTEPTLFKNFPALVRLAKQYNVPHVGFTTNGQLLTEQDIGRFVDYGLNELTISVHGVSKQMYEKFMVNASFENHHSVLRLVDKVKRERSSAKPALRINFTVNEANLPELDGFFQIYGQYEIGTLQVRPIIDFQGEFREGIGPKSFEQYQCILRKLREECKRKGVILLANTADPGYQQTNHNSAILQAVHRRITPMEVWRPDFDWRNESYVAFCKRIGWSKYLLQCVFSNLKGVIAHNAGMWGHHSAKYDVNL